MTELTMRETLGELRLDQLRALILETKPGRIILPGGLSMATGSVFSDPWVALSASELTILLDELGALRAAAPPLDEGPGVA